MNFFAEIILYLKRIVSLCLKLLIDDYSLQVLDSIRNHRKILNKRLKIFIFGKLSKLVLDEMSKDNDVVIFDSESDINELKKVQNTKFDVCILVRICELTNGFNDILLRIRSNSESSIVIDSILCHFSSAQERFLNNIEQTSTYFRFGAKGLAGIYYSNINPLEDHVFWYIFLFFIILMGVASYFFTFQIPQDDLLRHLVAYKYDYDYSKLYPETWLFNGYRIYLGFEEIYGVLHKSFKENAIPIVQSFAFLLYSIIFFLFLGKYIKDDGLLMITSFLFLAYLIEPRFILGRPTIFVSLLFVVSLFTHNILVSLFFGFLIVFSYYFWVPYVLLLILVRREHLLTLIVAILFWHFHSDGKFFSDLIYFIQKTKDNETFFPIGELGSLLYGIISNPYYLLPLIFYYYFGNKKYLPIILI
ncbi:MAG: hypothetical protein QW076_05865, partial [Candidatus Anstonellales archaeon]